AESRGDDGVLPAARELGRDRLLGARREMAEVIEQGRRFERDRRLSADVVIVGTGAGGGMVASELARRGARVVALEEGPLLEPPDMTQLEDDMMAKLYQERGGRATSDLAIRVIGGRCIGGSTVH